MTRSRHSRPATALRRRLRRYSQGRETEGTLLLTTTADRRTLRTECPKRRGEKNFDEFLLARTCRFILFSEVINGLCQCRHAHQQHWCTARLRLLQVAERSLLRRGTSCRCPTAVGPRPLHDTISHPRAMGLGGIQCRRCLLVAVPVLVDLRPKRTKNPTVFESRRKCHGGGRRVEPPTNLVRIQRPILYGTSEPSASDSCRPTDPQRSILGPEPPLGAWTQRALPTPKSTSAATLFHQKYLQDAARKDNFCGRQASRAPGPMGRSPFDRELTARGTAHTSSVKHFLVSSSAAVALSHLVVCKCFCFFEVCRATVARSWHCIHRG